MLTGCVVNISEGRDPATLAALDATVAPLLLDRHRDPDHHRAVYTLIGPADEVARGVRSLARAAVARLDLSLHQGAHPRLGVLDVVPFIPYDPGRPPPTDLHAPQGPLAPVGLRDDFARWLGHELGVPSFLYGPLPGGRTRTLPYIRRHAFAELAPDNGPGRPHPSAGACAVGARSVLVAYNVWVSSPEVARQVAPLVRGPAVRALGLAVGARAQVSCNLIDPQRFGPGRLYDLVAAEAARAGGGVEGAELVGLLPRSVLYDIAEHRWPELDLSDGRTVEARLERLTGPAG